MTSEHHKRPAGHLPEKYAPTAATVRAAFDDETFTGWMLWPLSFQLITPEESP